MRHRKKLILIFSVLIILFFGFLISQKSFKANADISTSLVGYWKFDETTGITAADSSGSGNNGTLNPSTGGPTWTTGKVNNALSFDGVDDYVNAGNFTSLNNAPALTISFWAKQNNISYWKDYITKLSQGGDNYNLRITAGNPPSQIRFQISNGSLAYGDTSIGAVSDNTWHYITMVFDGAQATNSTRLKAYINGQPQTLTFTGTIPATTANYYQDILAIGGCKIYGCGYFPGIIDEVLVYNRALSSSDIQTLYNGSAPPIPFCGDAVCNSGETCSTCSQDCGVCPAQDTTPPSIPANLSATAISSSQINLSWSASSDNIGVTGYKVFRNASQIVTSVNNSYSDTGLSPSTTYIYTVSAYDAAGNNSNQSSQASATTQASADTTPPQRSSGSPSGSLSSGTTQTTLSLATNETATCKYSTIANTAYDSITNTFTNTNSTNHSTIVTGLQSGRSYAYYIRCVDQAGNKNTDDFVISFSVANPVSQGGEGWTNLNPSVPVLISTQSSMTFDSEAGAIYMIGGHPIGGSFPQVPELYKYNIFGTNAWSVIRPDSDQPPANDTSMANTFDEANRKLWKIGTTLASYGQYEREHHLIGSEPFTASAEGGIQIYDTLTNKWIFLYNNFNAPSIAGDSRSAYDRKSQIIWHLPHGNQGFFALDPFLNKWTQKGNWGNTPKDCSQVLAADYHQNKIFYYCPDPSKPTSRSTQIYDPITNIWTDKTPSPIPPSWEFVNGQWVKGSYPPMAFSGEGGFYSVQDSAAVYDSINKKVLVFIPINPPPAWTPAHVVDTVGYATAPSVWNGWIYTATALIGDSKTGNSEPNWPTTAGQTVADGNVTWKAEFSMGPNSFDHLEVWAYDVATNVWEYKSSLPIGIYKRAGDIFAVYSQEKNLTYVTVLCRSGSSEVCNQYYTYQYAPGFKLSAPKGLQVSLAGLSAVLSWNSVPGAVGYNLYEASGNPDTPWNLAYAKINSNPILQTNYTDSAVSNGNTYFYYVVSVDSSANQSDQSIIVRTQPYLTLQGYVSVNSVNSQTINWTAVPNAAGYNIYRADCSVTTYGANWTQTVTSGWIHDSGNSYWRKIGDDHPEALGNSIGLLPGVVIDETTHTTLKKVLTLSELRATPNSFWFEPYSGSKFYVNIGQSPITDAITYKWERLYGNMTEAYYDADAIKTLSPGTFTKINSSLVTGTSFIDSANLSGNKVYAYRVRAVNALGVEAGISPHWFTIPSAPARLNWKENWSSNSGTMQLEWKPNQELGIIGYNVYRQWGDYTMERIATNINSTAISDILHYGPSEMGQMGYYVTAINILGQEGIPTSRALINRSYKSVYDSLGLLNGYYTVSNQPADTTPPQAPQNVRVS